MRKPEFTDGDRRMKISSDSVEIVATERWGRWDVEMLTSGPFASGLPEADARELLQTLLQLHCKAITAARTRTKPMRIACQACGRSVAVIRGKVGWHNEVEPGPGVEPKMCRGFGATPPGEPPSSAGGGAP